MVVRANRGELIQALDAITSWHNWALVIDFGGDLGNVENGCSSSKFCSCCGRGNLRGLFARWHHFEPAHLWRGYE